MSITRPGAVPTRVPRRQAMKAMAGMASAVMVWPARVLGAGLREPRVVELVHTHTHEQLSLTVPASGAHASDGLAALNRFLRDHRTGDIHPIDPGLLDILADLHAAVGASGAHHVISGYRSPRTNAALRERSRGVAAGSLHVEGRAIDVRLDGVGCSVLRDAAISLRRGGVGYYAASDFVHLDTGRVRAW
jgi:uncharacterized protein YcbK (DUF882 family)